MPPVPSEIHEIRPTLAARRETPPRAPHPGALKGRALTRHFAGVRSSPSVRPFGPPPVRARGVMVIARKVLSHAAALKALGSQLRYLERETAGAENGGRFFDGQGDQADPKAFRLNCRDDPGHYRLIVSPDDDCVLPDLRDYGRRLMQAVAQERGARLEWIAADHYDTGRPHLHILLRDRCLDGGRLALERRFLNGGLKETAEELATELIGPQVDRFPTRTLKADRFTPLDCVMLEEAPGGVLEASRLPLHWRPDVLRRLGHLESRGWVEALAPGVWKVPPDLRSTLRKVSQRDAREIAAVRALRDGGWSDDRHRLRALALEPRERLVGAFVGVHRTGPYSRGSQELVVDATDGRLAHVLMRDVHSVMCLDRIQKGAVVEVVGAPREPRAVDGTIAEVAAASGGIWSTENHVAARPDDWRKFVGFHLKRVEALARDGACSPLGEGRFAIPADFTRRAMQADADLWGPSEHRLRVLDHRTLEEQVSAPGLTWLDRLMSRTERVDLAGPFGDAVGRALPEREKRLRMTGLGAGDPLVLSETDLERLRILEVKSVMEPLAARGKAVFLVSEGQRAQGVYVGRVHMAGAPFAVLEGRSALHLMRWTPGLEACRGKALDAVMQGGVPDFRAIRGAARELSLG